MLLPEIFLLKFVQEPTYMSKKKQDIGPYSYINKKTLKQLEIQG